MLARTTFYPFGAARMTLCAITQRAPTRELSSALNMSEQRDGAAKTELDELLNASARAVVEFNLATAPLIVALTAGAASGR